MAEHSQDNLEPLQDGTADADTGEKTVGATHTRKYTSFKTKNVRSWLITIAIAGALAGIVGFFNLEMATDAVGAVRLLSDMFVLPGVVYVGISALIFASNAGTFRMFSYGAKRFYSTVSRSEEFRRQYRDYYQYYEEKAKNKVPCYKLLIVGLACFALAVIFNVLYYYV